jgi:bacterioferritin
MKGHKELLTDLNLILADEIAAINQSLVYLKRCENWGYARLLLAFRKEAMDEMFYVDCLLDRILVFEGLKKDPEMIGTEPGDELDVLYAYNSVIQLAREVDDPGSADLLNSVLRMEEYHMDWPEIQLAQIVQMNNANNLVGRTQSMAG